MTDSAQMATEALRRFKGKGSLHNRTGFVLDALEAIAGGNGETCKPAGDAGVQVVQSEQHPDPPAWWAKFQQRGLLLSAVASGSSTGRWPPQDSTTLPCRAGRSPAGHAERSRS